MLKQRYIPEGSIAVRAKSAPVVAYLWEREGVPFACGYTGKAQKPAFYQRWTNHEKRAMAVSRWMESQISAEQQRAELRAKRAEARNQPHGLQVGDILYTSWGYDQTNVEFFEVVAMHGKCTVELREVAHGSQETSSMQGDCVPIPGRYIADPIRRRADSSGTVKIDECRRAWKLEPLATVGGVRVYPPKHWTAYA